MIAIDTNVLVRVLTNDDPEQARRAVKRMRSATVWISRTVLLETEWVLRYTYKLGTFAIGKAFTTLLGVASVEIEDRVAVQRALAWHASGMDFADALHLAKSDAASEFVSFDRNLARAAKKAGATPKVAVP
ncbi:MAG: type II toxin-antitoxin system VapC family toxin [Deltaproteobacteria bacterium]